jgi:hypothetical protein
MISMKAFLGIVLMASAPSLSNILELQTETVAVWEEYVRSADLRMQARLDVQKPFLWADESPDRKLRVRRGEIVVAPVVGHGTWKVPNGLIHDWIGAVFIPGATIEELSAVMHDYGRYKDFYRPVVVESKLFSCTATDQKFSMVWQRRVLFVNAVIEGQYQAHEVRLDARRGYNVAGTTQVQEIENYGHAGQRLLPASTGTGYIWRLHSIARYQQRDGGVYLELEAIALTRDIPASVRWLINPVVNHLSMNSITATLVQTRDAVKSLLANPQLPIFCENQSPISTTAKPVQSFDAYSVAPTCEC